MGSNSATFVPCLHGTAHVFWTGIAPFFSFTGAAHCYKSATLYRFALAITVRTGDSRMHGAVLGTENQVLGLRLCNMAVTLQHPAVHTGFRYFLVGPLMTWLPLPVALGTCTVYFRLQ